MRSVLNLVVLGALLGGCYQSHEAADRLLARVDGGPRDVGVMRDGSLGLDAAMSRDASVRDSFPSVDATLRTDAPRVDGSTCGSERGVVVRVEPITSERARCAVAHVEAAAVYGVERAPDDDGIRIHADFCPEADADCRCDIVVANVGADLAELVLIPRVGLIIDVGPTALHVDQIPTCECLGCPCALRLVLHAVDGLLAPPEGASELVLSEGALVCAEPSPCVSPTWTLHAESLGVEADVPAGEDRDLGIVHVRSVRDVDIFGPCAACASCGSAQGSWVAWVRH